MVQFNTHIRILYTAALHQETENLILVAIWLYKHTVISKMAMPKLFQANIDFNLLNHILDISLYSASLH